MNFNFFTLFHLFTIDPSQRNASQSAVCACVDALLRPSEATVHQFDASNSVGPAGGFVLTWKITSPFALNLLCRRRQRCGVEPSHT